jgi:hypothetical protein
MKRPECPFCGQVITRPMEMPPYHPGQMPVGSCTCGAVYSCDVSGKNIGQALLEALMFLCKGDLDLAGELLEGADYYDRRVEHYDLVSHLVVQRGFLEGRKVNGVLLFLRPSEELSKELNLSPKNKTTQAQVRSETAPRQLSKGLVEKWVTEGNMEEIRKEARNSDSILKFIQRLLYSGDVELRNKAAEALGIACSEVADYKPSIVSRILQGLLYSISDTAASSWGAFEAVSEIIARRFDLFSGYLAYLYPFIADESKREYGLSAIARISQDHPKAIRKLTLHFIPYLKDKNPMVRAHTIRLMGNLGAFEVKPELHALFEDNTGVSIYQNGRLNMTTISELAKESVAAIGD